MVDDLLDFQGEAQNTGKQIGNDFVEGKITLPLLHTLDRASAEDRQTIETLLRGDRTQPEAYQQLVTLIGRYEGFTSAARTAQQHIALAIDALAPFSRRATRTKRHPVERLGRLHYRQKQITGPVVLFPSPADPQTARSYSFSSSFFL